MGNTTCCGYCGDPELQFKHILYEIYPKKEVFLEEQLNTGGESNNNQNQTNATARSNYSFADNDDDASLTSQSINNLDLSIDQPPQISANNNTEEDLEAQQHGPTNTSRFIDDDDHDENGNEIDVLASTAHFDNGISLNNSISGGRTQQQQQRAHTKRKHHHHHHNSSSDESSANRFGVDYDRKALLHLIRFVQRDQFKKVKLVLGKVVKVMEADAVELSKLCEPEEEGNSNFNNNNDQENKKDDTTTATTNVLTKLEDEAAQNSKKDDPSSSVSSAATTSTRKRVVQIYTPQEDEERIRNIALNIATAAEEKEQKRQEEAIQQFSYASLSADAQYYLARIQCGALILREFLEFDENNDNAAMMTHNNKKSNHQSKSRSRRRRNNDGSLLITPQTIDLYVPVVLRACEALIYKRSEPPLRISGTELFAVLCRKLSELSSTNVAPSSSPLLVSTPKNSSFGNNNNNNNNNSFGEDSNTTKKKDSGEEILSDSSSSPMNNINADGTKRNDSNDDDETPHQMLVSTATPIQALASSASLVSFVAGNYHEESRRLIVSTQEHTTIPQLVRMTHLGMNTTSIDALHQRYSSLIAIAEITNCLGTWLPNNTEIILSLSETLFKWFHLASPNLVVVVPPSPSRNNNNNNKSSSSYAAKEKEARRNCLRLACSDFKTTATSSNGDENNMNTNNNNSEFMMKNNTARQHEHYSNNYNNQQQQQVPIGPLNLDSVVRDWSVLRVFLNAISAVSTSTTQDDIYAIIVDPLLDFLTDNKLWWASSEKILALEKRKKMLRNNEKKHELVMMSGDESEGEENNNNATAAVESHYKFRKPNNTSSMYGHYFGLQSSPTTAAISSSPSSTNRHEDDLHLLLSPREQQQQQQQQLQNSNTNNNTNNNQEERGGGAPTFSIPHFSWVLCRTIAVSLERQHDFGFKFLERILERLIPLPTRATATKESKTRIRERIGMINAIMEIAEVIPLNDDNNNNNETNQRAIKIVDAVKKCLYSANQKKNLLSPAAMMANSFLKAHNQMTEEEAFLLEKQQRVAVDCITTISMRVALKANWTALSQIADSLLNEMKSVLPVSANLGKSAATILRNHNNHSSGKSSTNGGVGKNLLEFQEKQRREEEARRRRSIDKQQHQGSLLLSSSSSQQQFAHHPQDIDNISSSLAVTPSSSAMFHDPFISPYEFTTKVSPSPVTASSSSSMQRVGATPRNLFGSTPRSAANSSSSHRTMLAPLSPATTITNTANVEGKTLLADENNANTTSIGNSSSSATKPSSIAQSPSSSTSRVTLTLPLWTILTRIAPLLRYLPAAERKKLNFIQRVTSFLFDHGEALALRCLAHHLDGGGRPGRTRMMAVPTSSHLVLSGFSNESSSTTSTLDAEASSSTSFSASSLGLMNENEKAITKLYENIPLIPLNQFEFMSVVDEEQLEKNIKEREKEKEINNSNNNSSSNNIPPPLSPSKLSAGKFPISSTANSLLEMTSNNNTSSSSNNNKSLPPLASSSTKTIININNYSNNLARTTKVITSLEFIEKIFLKQQLQMIMMSTTHQTQQQENSSSSSSATTTIPPIIQHGAFNSPIGIVSFIDFCKAFLNLFLKSKTTAKFVPILVINVILDFCQGFAVSEIKEQKDKCATKQQQMMKKKKRALMFFSSSSENETANDENKIIEQEEEKSEEETVLPFYYISEFAAAWSFAGLALLQVLGTELQIPDLISYARELVKRRQQTDVTMLQHNRKEELIMLAVKKNNENSSIAEQQQQRIIAESRKLMMMNQKKNGTNIISDLIANSTVLNPELLLDENNDEGSSDPFLQQQRRNQQQQYQNNEKLVPPCFQTKSSVLFQSTTQQQQQSISTAAKSSSNSKSDGINNNKRKLAPHNSGFAVANGFEFDFLDRKNRTILVEDVDDLHLIKKETLKVYLSQKYGEDIVEKMLPSSVQKN